MTFRTTGPALLAATALATPLWAQGQEPVDLGTLVLQGYLPAEASRTGATVEVVEGGLLENPGTGVDDALERVPGVTVSASGGLGQASSVRVRGLDQRYLETRLDGIDVADPSAPQTGLNFGTLTAGMVDRAEVLKGAQSAIFGSNAVAGGILMETWRPTDDGLSGRGTISAGSFGTYAGQLSFGVRADRGEAWATVAGVTSDGFSARSGDDEADALDQTAFALGGEGDFGAVRVGANLFSIDTEAEFDRSAASAFGPADNTGLADDLQRGARVFAELSTGPVDHVFTLSAYRVDRIDEGGFTERFSGERDRAEWIATTPLGPTARLAFGAEAYVERARNDADAFETNGAAVFSEALLTPRDGTDLSLALRYDIPNDTDAEVTGRIALSQRLDDATRLRAVVGRGFRQPSLYERFNPLFGNPDLTPETSWSAEVGAERDVLGGTVAATAFVSAIDDRIDFGAATYEQVPGTTLTRGIELSGRVPVTDAVTVFGAYTYTEADTEGTRTLRVPRNDLLLGAEADFGRFAVAGEVRHVGGSLDYTDFPTVEPLGDYTLVNLGATVALSDRAEAFLRVENLTGEDYETVRGYNQPGRAVFAGLRASF